MRSNPILQEARTLHNVSDRLDALAGEHPIASDALITFGKRSPHRHTAGGGGSDENGIALRTGYGRCLID
jgi:hypothetical protein